MARFKKGKDPKRGPGGYRPGAGRPKDEFLIKVKTIGDPLKVIQFLYDTTMGKPVEHPDIKKEKTVLLPAEIKERIRAGEMYLDRRVGKVEQNMKHSGNLTLEEIISEANEGTD